MALPADPLLLISCRHADVIEPGSDRSAAPLFELEQLLPLLAPTERGRAAALPPAAQPLFVLSRALLRAAAAELLGELPAALTIERDVHGKPHFSEVGRELHFNYAHSRDWLLLALSRHGPVGVDVDSDRRQNRFHAIAHRYYQPAEIATINALPREPLRRQRFIELWTLKEAYAKLLGYGLATTLPGMRFELSPGGAHAHLYASGEASCSLPVQGWQWRLGSGSVGALMQLTPAVRYEQSRYDAAAAPSLLEAVPLGSAFHYRTWAPDLLRTVAAAPATPC